MLPLMRLCTPLCGVPSSGPVAPDAICHCWLVLFCAGGFALPKISNVVSALMFAITVLPVTLVGSVMVCELRVLSNSAFGCPLKFCAANAAGSCGFAVQSQ